MNRKFLIDTYTILSQNLIGCLTLSQEYCKLIGLQVYKSIARQFWTLACNIEVILCGMALIKLSTIGMLVKFIQIDDVYVILSRY